MTVYDVGVWAKSVYHLLLCPHPSLFEYQRSALPTWFSVSLDVPKTLRFESRLINCLRTYNMSPNPQIG